MERVGPDRAVTRFTWWVGTPQGEAVHETQARSKACKRRPAADDLPGLAPAPHLLSSRVASLSFASDFVIHEVGVDYVLGVGKGELDEEMIEAYTLRRPAAGGSQVHQACASP